MTVSRHGAVIPTLPQFGGDRSAGLAIIDFDAGRAAEAGPASAGGIPFKHAVIIFGGASVPVWLSECVAWVVSYPFAVFAVDEEHAIFADVFESPPRWEGPVPLEEVCCLLQSAVPGWPKEE